MLPFRSGPIRIAIVLFFSLAVCLCPAQQPTAKGGKKQQKQQKKAAEAKPDEKIPLPVGHEAKGLVLPDYDAEGRLRGRFEAGLARRINESSVELKDLKVTTFTLDNKPELQIAMSQSLLDLNTRLLTSQHRTTVRRNDFQIEGDSMQFDSIARKGTLTGNVKMVIMGQSGLLPEKP